MVNVNIFQKYNNEYFVLYNQKIIHIQINNVYEEKFTRGSLIANAANSPRRPYIEWIKTVGVISNNFIEDVTLKNNYQ